MRRDSRGQWGNNVNRGVLGVLVGLGAAIAGLWASRRFFGASEGETTFGAGGAPGAAMGGDAAAHREGLDREGLDPTLLEILACPDDKSPVIYQKEGDAERLTCTACGKRYPVRDGIPVMLLDEASPGPVPPESEVAAAKALIPQGKPAVVAPA